MRARTVGAGVVGTLVLMSTAASAAGLSWSVDSLAAASAAVPSCTVAFAASPYVLDAAGLVTHVRVGRQAAGSACTTGTVLVSLRDASGVAVGSGSLASVACGSEACVVPLSSPPGLETVRAAHVLVVAS